MALSICGLLFLEQLAFGGGRQEVALGFAAAQALLLSVIVLTAPWARRDLGRVSGLAAPALLFLATILAILWSLTPFVPGGPHPLWSYVTAIPAAAVDKSAVFIETVNLLALASVFLLGRLLGASDDRARYFLGALIVCCGVYAAWAFVSHLLDPDLLFGFLPRPFGARRLSGSFFSANTAAAFFGVSVVLAACAVTDRLRSRSEASGVPSIHRAIGRGAVGLTVLAFSAACLIMTASRGGMTATAVALVLFFCWEAVARRWRLLGLPGLGLLCLIGGLAALLAIGGTPFFQRLLEVEEGAAVRQQINLIHWRAFLASPWLGYGLGTFDSINKLVATAPDYRVLWNLHATHDVYLQWLEETGLIGAIPMFLCIGSIIAITAQGALRRIRMTTWLRGLVASSFVILIHGTSDFGLQIPSMAAMWACLLGLGSALAIRPGGR